MPKAGAKRQVPGARDDHRAPADEDDTSSSSSSSSSLDFEDPYEDEFDSEEDAIINYDSDDESLDPDMLAGVGGMGVRGAHAVDDDEMGNTAAPKAMWRPGVDELGDDEELVYDSSAYQMLHRMTMEWSCLSLDVMRDPHGYNRASFPHSALFVTGSQAANAADNRLYVIQASSLCKTKHDDDSVDGDDDDDDDDDSDAEDDPVVDFRRVAHRGCVNRVRSMPQRSSIVASWSDTGSVFTWDLSAQVRSLETNGLEAAPADTAPLVNFTGHGTEGYALDWSTTVPGRLLSGDNNRTMRLWEPRIDAGTWQVDAAAPFRGHTSSVEDIQWSPNQPNVFASCSADRTIRVWDTSMGRAPALTITAHEADVNVISWHPRAPHLLASGCDDGSFRIWDMRNFSPVGATPAAMFHFHRAPITTVRWDPAEDSQLAVCCEKMATVWDMSVERDTETEAQVAELPDVPPQLLFVHAGQEQIKELCYHPQIPGCLVTTALDGFNILIPDIQIVGDAAGEMGPPAAAAASSSSSSAAAVRK